MAHNPLIFLYPDEEIHKVKIQCDLPFAPTDAPSLLLHILIHYHHTQQSVSLTEKFQVRTFKKS